MRMMILMRGAQGAGKSTFIMEQGLSPYVVSPDQERLRRGGLILNPSGEPVVNHRHEALIWSELKGLLELKLSEGQLVVFDATFQGPQSFQFVERLALKHRYQVFCVDLTGVPLEQALARNLQRAPWQRIPPEAIAQAYRRFAQTPIPPWISRLTPESLGGAPLISFLEPDERDLTATESVVHLGPLRGALTALSSLLPQGIKDDTHYVFVGDLLGAGPESADCLRFILRELLPRSNVTLLWGPIEAALHRHCRGIEQGNPFIEEQLLPALTREGLAQDALEAFFDGLVELFPYRISQHRALVTPRPLPRWPSALVPVPSWQLLSGFKEAGQSALKEADLKDTDLKETRLSRARGEEPSQGASLSAQLPRSPLPRELLISGLESGGRSKLQTAAGRFSLEGADGFGALPLRLDLRQIRSATGDSVAGDSVAGDSVAGDSVVTVERFRQRS